MNPRFLPGLFLVLLLSCAPDRPPELDRLLVEAKKQNQMVFLELERAGCYACRQMIPVVSRLHRDYGGRILIRRFDVEQFPALGKKFEVVVTPTQVILDSHGRELLRRSGYLPYPDMVRLIKNLHLNPD